ncbi:MAG: HAD-IA family hydrolase [Acidimicrobiia bacterium]
MSRLPHVVWDMGGIMWRYFTELMVIQGAAAGWPMERLPLGPTGPAPDPYYVEMLDGDLDEPEYIELIHDKLAAEGIAFHPVRDLDWHDAMRPETWAAIEKIAAVGHRQAVLTNDATRWLGERWWDTWDRAGLFDAVVDVTQIGVRKPAPEPYLTVAAALGVPAGECLFVDDLPANCRGAEAVGMTSHLFDITAPQRSIATLLETLGLAPAAGSAP